ncbi:hypothetical protein TNCV_1343901, partial [Trichonephila clavipes]
MGVRILFRRDTTLLSVTSWCTRNDDKAILPQSLDGGYSSPFSVEAVLYGRVSSWCTRNDDNDILPRPRSGVIVNFSVEALLCCRFRLGVRGTMTTTSYSGHVKVGVRILFPSRHYCAVLETFWCTRKDDNDILPQPLGDGCSSIFTKEAIFCCSVASWCTRNDDNDILPQPFGGVCSSTFSVEAHLILSVASWCTR